MHHFHLQVSRNNVVLAILTDYQVSDVFKYLIHAKVGYLWFKKNKNLYLTYLHRSYTSPYSEQLP